MGFFSSSRKRARREGGKTIIAEGCVLRGEISKLDGSLLVDGQFEGVIESDFDLAIGLHGTVKGLIKARHIIVTGSLEGKVVCEHLEILKEGKFVGEMIAGDLAIETGGKFIGKSHELTESGQVVEFQPEEKRAVIENIVVVERQTLQPQEAQELKAAETSSTINTPP